MDAVWEQTVPYYRKMGFARVNYTYTRFLTETSYGDPDDALFLTTNSPEYIKYFLRDGFYAKTPLFHWAIKNVGACTWRWVQEAYDAGKLSPTEAETVRSNLAMGVRAGVTISFPTVSPRSKAGLGLIADPDLTHDDVDRIWAESGPEIMAVANMMHLKVSQLPQVSRHRSLTPRQREALGWVADGKTTQDIATIMGVSVAMVEKHLRLARETLDVDTTAQAVAKATLLNQIFHHNSHFVTGDS
ncbi:MAG: autoinducer binding domain-containing protein [Paracoccaceae bacterium]|nr:autoinducer binding domain-containing protein [Paracoccaceae bacterium]